MPTLKLKLDENLSERHARVTRERGCDAATVADESLSSASDSKVLDVASAEGRVLITLDKDFSNTIRFPPERYTGIVLLRLPEPIGPTAIDRAIGVFLDAVATRTPVRRLWIIDRERVREFAKPESE